MGSVSESLLKGKTFPLAFLANHQDEIDLFWKAWWKAVDRTQLSRPFTVSDEDAILIKTVDKPTVNTIAHAHWFTTYLGDALKKEELLTGYTLPRPQFREDIADHLFTKLEKDDRREVVFVGGGYGSGKTVTMDVLTKREGIPLKGLQLTGVDVCKHFLPEFGILKGVRDGRASSVVQEEARQISEILFSRLVESGHSFGWDSSMSHREATLAKINATRDKGYRVTMVGVFTRLDVARVRAMTRARKMRRFSHPDYFDKSHIGFAANFMEYAELCDHVILFDNNGLSSTGMYDPVMIAEKESLQGDLDVFDIQLFSEFRNTSI